MATHVKVIAALYAACGALLALGAFFTRILIAFAARMIALSGDPDAQTGEAILGLAGTMLTIILLTLAIPFFITAWGLWNFKGWARIAGIILAVLSLFNMPFGTLLGVYAMVILFRQDTEKLFSTT